QFTKKAQPPSVPSQHPSYSAPVGNYQRSTVFRPKGAQAEGGEEKTVVVANSQLRRVVSKQSAQEPVVNEEEKQKVEAPAEPVQRRLIRNKHEDKVIETKEKEAYLRQAFRQSIDRAFS